MSKLQPPALRALLYLMVACSGSASLAASQHPVIPGLHGEHGLEQAEAGRVLLAELRCAACHMDVPAGAMPLAPGPDLSAVGSRLHPDYLRRYLADPRTTQPGTKMPDLLAGRSQTEREEIADALTHFLMGSAAGDAAPMNTEATDQGALLYHKVGCVVCHGARRPAYEGGHMPAPQPGRVDLTHVSAKYKPNALAAFLYEPRHARPSGRMPDMGLSRAEAGSLATYLLGTGSKPGSKLSIDADKARAGQGYYKSLGCAACHSLPGFTHTPSAAPTPKNLNAGCLAPEPGKAPDYALDQAQRQSLIAALSSTRTRTTDDQINQTLVGLNCIACHERDGRGGAPQADRDYFGTDEPNLGEHASMPPRLNLAGAKLRPAWMRKVLFDGATARPYMHTRMPQFGAQNLQNLPDQLAEVDQLPEYEMPIYKGDASRAARDGGRELLGIRGLACISCHNFNGKLSPNMHGMDLIDTCERLQPAWFAGFLVDPQKYRPGIVMPESWSGGVAAHQGILDGDTAAQIRAIWFFLGQGRTASDPAGMIPHNSKLTVGDRPRLYRGRSGLAGYRGIAVGFPGGMNYAFSARTGALSGVWRGDFVSVRWSGQGAGGFNPASRAIPLARDLALALLDPEQQTWPLRPRVSKEQPINQDPDYPRNLGYQFGGYSFDKAGVPTFEYAIGELQVLDRTTAGPDTLTRVLSIRSPKAQSLWFRALVGEVQQLDQQNFQLGKLKLHTPGVASLLRPTDSPDGPSELLLELTLPAGTSTWSFEYAINQ